MQRDEKALYWWLLARGERARGIGGDFETILGEFQGELKHAWRTINHESNEEQEGPAHGPDGV